MDAVIGEVMNKWDTFVSVAFGVYVGGIVLMITLYVFLRQAIINAANTPIR